MLVAITGLMKFSKRQTNLEEGGIEVKIISFLFFLRIFVCCKSEAYEIQIYTITFIVLFLHPGRQSRVIQII